MKRKKELKPPSVINQEYKQAQTLIGNLLQWWQSLTTRQRLTLILCVLLVIGVTFGVSIRASTRSNRTPKEKRLIKRSEFFSDPLHKCLPLTQKPEQTERNKNTPVTYSRNLKTGWFGTLKFGFEDNLLDDLFGKHYDKKEIINKLNKLMAAVSDTNFSKFQKTAVYGTVFRIVRPEYIYGASAMVTPSDGDICISIDLDPKEYKATIQNELSHIEIRYVNIVKCGVELPPKEKFIVLFPFITSDWKIDYQLQNELETHLKNGHQLVTNYLKLHADGAVVTEESTILRHNIDHIISTAYQLPLDQAFYMFRDTFFLRLDLSEGISTAIGGTSRRIMEQVSDLREFPTEVRRYFYSGVESYLERYNAMSCVIEPETSRLNQPNRI